MHWDQDALSAPHTQRELDSIPQLTPTVKELHALRVKLDRAQSEVSRLKQELAREKRHYDKAHDEVISLQSDLAAEKALADLLYEALIYERTIDRAASIKAYRKARGM